MAVNLALMVVGVGLSLYAQHRAAKRNKNVLQDDKPPALTSRGAYLPRLIGRQRVAPIFGYAYNRTTKKEKVAEGKGGGGDIEQDVYYEGGWHQCTVGPAYALWRIWESGKVIWEGPVGPLVKDPVSGDIETASSTLISIGTPGSFRVYFGQPNQPINSILGNATNNPVLGVNSRWPYVAYVHWIEKRLSTQPVWPFLEYEWVVKPYATGLTQSDPWIEDTSADPIGKPNFDDGANVAHVLWDIMFNRYPHGIGLPQGRFDMDSLEQLGIDLGPAGERACCHIFAEDGANAEDILASILQDYGINISLDVTTGLYRFVCVRKTLTAIPDLSPDLILAPAPEIRKRHDGREIDNIAYTFRDRTRSFRDTTIGSPDDAQTHIDGGQASETVEIRTTVNHDTATRIVARRGQEAHADPGGHRLYVAREGRKLTPGRIITASGTLIGEHVVDRVRVDPKTSKVELDVVPNSYGITASLYDAQPGAGLDLEVVPPSPDAQFDPIEVPHEALGTGTQAQSIIVPRVRFDAQTQSAQIFISGDDSFFAPLGSDTSGIAGGPLVTGMPAEDWDVDTPVDSGFTTILEEGPTFTAQGPDIANVLDLSGDTANWRAGRQIAVFVFAGSPVDHTFVEICFLRNITDLGSGLYRLDGLLRRRQMTRGRSVGTGWNVYIFTADQPFGIQGDPLLTPGATVYVKAVPNGLTTADVSSRQIDLQGWGQIGMRPANLRNKTYGQGYSWHAGDDIEFKWAYRSGSNHLSGAGNIGAGAQGAPAEMLGHARLKLYDVPGGVLQLTIDVTAGLVETTLTNAALVSAFGAEPSFFEVDLVQVFNGYESAPDTTAGGLRPQFARA